MATGWSIDNRRIEFGAAFPAGKLIVKESGQNVHEQKLATKGEWQLPVGGASYKVVRVKGFMGPKTELFDARGRKVPPSDKHASPSPAAPGSTCPAHQAAARFACARCGTFVCGECAGADLTHCQTCCDKMMKEADKNAAAMAYLAPTIVMGVVGGLLLALFAGGAGAIAVTIAKRTESKAVKIGAAVGLYTLAVVAWLIVVALIQGE
ncbi:MAG: hypothetical protein JNK82_08415 [Myxococcaceae bacterium]|nr:hypothetical protein [Myxococcaceae bacterium]